MHTHVTFFEGRDDVGGAEVGLAEVAAAVAPPHLRALRQIAL